MGNVRRIFVEKKEPFAVKAKELLEEIKSYLGIQGVSEVRVLIRYDVENISDETFATACRRWTGFMKKHLRRLRIPVSLVWNTFPASLIRGRIQRCSASSF